MQIEPIIVAVLAAVPATLSALAARSEAKKAAQQVKPSNGHKLAEIVEDNSHLLKALSAAQSRLIEDFEDHLDDAEAHYREQHRHLQSKDVCPQCLALRDAE